MEDETSTLTGAAAGQTPEEELGAASAAHGVAGGEEATAEIGTAEPVPETPLDEDAARARPHHGHRIPPGEESRWLDDPANVKKGIRVFWGICALVLLVDLLALLGLGYDRDPHFDAERLPWFYGFYGFVACVALVLLAKGLRELVMQKEEYYDE